MDGADMRAGVHRAGPRRGQSTQGSRTTAGASHSPAGLGVQGSRTSQERTTRLRLQAPPLNPSTQLQALRGGGGQGASSCTFCIRSIVSRRSLLLLEVVVRATTPPHVPHVTSPSGSCPPASKPPGTRPLHHHRRFSPCFHHNARPLPHSVPPPVLFLTLPPKGDVMLLLD